MRAERVEIGERAAQYVTVVHARLHHDLGVELDAVLRERAELLDHVGGERIPQQPAADHRIGGVHRDVERRQPVRDDPLDVVRLEIGERREIAVAEREPVVVVADVQRLAKAGRIPLDEAEVAAVGAAADAGRLEREPHRLVQRPLDVELDLLAVGLADVEQKLLVGGEELPVQEILQLAAVDAHQLGAGSKTELCGDGIRLDGRHLDHGWPRWRRRHLNASATTSLPGILQVESKGGSTGRARFTVEMREPDGFRRRPPPQVVSRWSSVAAPSLLGCRGLDALAVINGDSVRERETGLEPATFSLGS